MLHYSVLYQFPTSYAILYLFAHLAAWEKVRQIKQYAMVRFNEHSSSFKGYIV